MTAKISQFDTIIALWHEAEEVTGRDIHIDDSRQGVYKVEVGDVTAEGDVEVFATEEAVVVYLLDLIEQATEGARCPECERSYGPHYRGTCTH